MERQLLEGSPGSADYRMRMNRLAVREVFLAVTHLPRGKWVCAHDPPLGAGVEARAPLDREVALAHPDLRVLPLQADLDGAPEAVGRRLGE